MVTMRDFSKIKRILSHFLFQTQKFIFTIFQADFSSFVNKINLREINFNEEALPVETFFQISRKTSET
jgi:hypothetical protein